MRCVARGDRGEASEGRKLACAESLRALEDGGEDLIEQNVQEDEGLRVEGRGLEIREERMGLQDERDVSGQASVMSSTGPFMPSSARSTKPRDEAGWMWRDE